MHESEQDWRAGGRFARLSDGLTHWRRRGPPDGKPLVLVHGATVPSWEFDALVPPLLRAGFQTLRFDLYGHGASDRPDGAYTFERFSRQVIEIIDSTNFPRPALLLGNSFGAALVASVAADRPDLAARLVLVAPMLDFNSSSGWAKVFRYPVIGELAMHFMGYPAWYAVDAGATRASASHIHVAIHRAGFVLRFRAWIAVDVPDRRARRSERALFGATLGRAGRARHHRRPRQHHSCRTRGARALAATALTLSGSGGTQSVAHTSGRCRERVGRVDESRLDRRPYWVSAAMRVGANALVPIQRQISRASRARPRTRSCR